jgi:hypothetical protein
MGHHSQAAGKATPDHQFVNDLLNEWDFIGVADLLEDGDDEYTCLVGPLLRLLRDGAGPAELVAYLDHELPEHFGLDGPAHRTAWFAAHLHAAWTERTL